MNTKDKFKIIGYSLFLVLIMSFSNAISNDFYHRKEKEILKELIFPGAFDVVMKDNKRLQTSALSYSIEIPYPANEILEFTEEILKKHGWMKRQQKKQSTDTNNQWEVFIDGTEEGEPVVHRWSEIWVNKEKTRMIIVVFKYYSYISNLKEKLCLKVPLNNILNIIIQIGPYVEISFEES